MIPILGENGDSEPQRELVEMQMDITKIEDKKIYGGNEWCFEFRGKNNHLFYKGFKELGNILESITTTLNMDEAEA